MRIARAIAAAALTLGLASTLSPAQAAPVAPAQVVAQVAEAPAQAKVAKAKTKLTVKAPKGKTKVGKTVKFKGKLTREDGHHYKPLVHKYVYLLFPTEDGPLLLAREKTSMKGKYTFEVKARKWMVGENYVYSSFEGDSKSYHSTSHSVLLKVKK